MAVWVLVCPDCGHSFRALVPAGTRAPRVWVCGRCESRDVRPQTVIEQDPVTHGTGTGCACG